MSVWEFPVVILVSLMSHGGFLGYMDSSEFRKNIAKQRQEPIAVKITVVEKPQDPPPKPPDPPKPKPKPKPKEVIKKVAALKKKEPDASPSDAKPIQGLNKDSFAPGGIGGFQAPVGNTLMTGDEGIRVGEAPELQQDLSSDAKLVPDSLVKPAYTDEALDLGLEGVFTIDVFVDENGAVTDVEIRKKIGSGMDERISQSVKTAKFVPRKDSMGKSIKGWAVISFRLTIP
jgi:protein TonB